MNTVVIGCVVLNMGTIRKKPNPILKTQTDPIAYKDKLEEIKDGIKGPPSPVWKLYARNGFLTEAPVDSNKDGVAEEVREKIPEVGEPIPEDLQGTEDPQFEDEWSEDSFDHTQEQKAGKGKEKAEKEW